MQNEDNKSNRAEANGRFLLSGNSDASFVIYSKGEGKHLGWASTVYEPERQARSLGRLLTLLDDRDRKHFAPRRKALNFPEPGGRVIEVELIAQRWRLVGTPALRVDRIARRLVCALKLRMNGAPPTAPRDARTAWRRIQGDSRKALQAAGAV